MTKRCVAVFVTFAVLVLGPNMRLSAHEGHEHKLMGTVTMAAADHVRVKDKNGKDVTIKVTTGTKVKATPVIKVEEIKAGTRVVITAIEQKDATLVAKTIEVGAAAPSKSMPR